MRTVHGQDVLALSEQLADTYADVFRGPPWNEGPDEVAEFRHRLRTDARRPGFRATVTGSGTIDGFVTAWPTELPLPRTRAYPRLVRHLGPDRLVSLLDGALQVDELAVRPGARGTGVGRRLLEQATAGHRAWLITSAAATGAVAFYRRCGWREVAPAGRGDGRLLVFVSPSGPTG